MATKELVRQQKCAELIYELGLGLSTSQAVITTSVSYMQMFYEKHTSEHFKYPYVAMASFYLACKMEDSSRKLEHVIQTMYKIIKMPQPSDKSDLFKQLVAQIHSLEGIILMVLGFPNIVIQQPHVHLVNALEKLSLPKLVEAQSYFVCTAMLIFTPLTIKYNSELIASASIQLSLQAHDIPIPENFKGLFSSDVTHDKVALVIKLFKNFYEGLSIKQKEKLRALQIAHLKISVHNRPVARPPSKPMAPPNSESMKPAVSSTEDSYDDQRWKRNDHRVGDKHFPQHKGQGPPAGHKPNYHPHRNQESWAHHNRAHAAYNHNQQHRNPTSHTNFNRHPQGSGHPPRDSRMPRGLEDRRERRLSDSERNRSDNHSPSKRTYNTSANADRGPDHQGWIHDKRINDSVDGSFSAKRPRPNDWHNNKVSGKAQHPKVVDPRWNDDFNAMF